MSITGKEILVVEDIEDQRLLIKRILENAGAVVTVADSVASALEYLAKKAPHLLLLDLRMPGVDGFALLEKKKTVESLAMVPIVVVSGLQDKESVYRAISLGASDYVVKPLVVPLLLQKIRKNLRDSEFHRHTFSPEAPALTVSIVSEITKLSATSFYLDSPLKIGAETQIELEGAGLDELGLKQCLFVTDKVPFTRALSGFYTGKINALGLKKAIPLKPGKSRA